MEQHPSGDRNGLDLSAFHKSLKTWLLPRHMDGEVKQFLLVKWILLFLLVELVGHLLSGLLIYFCWL